MNRPYKEDFTTHQPRVIYNQARGSQCLLWDADGKPIQYIHYAPYGELIANQQTIGYDERYKFTGKERDAETGYDYFGARFYDHRKGIWNSVDPLADKYPNVTPYLYCNGNPIMLVDPDGRDVAILLAHNGVWKMGHMAILIQDAEKVWHLYSKNGEGKPEDLGALLNDRGEITATSVENFLNNKTDNTVTHTEGDIFPYYTAALIINTSPEQDKIIQKGVEEKINEPYNFFFNNCTEAIQKGLRDAGVDVIPTIIPIRSFYYMWYMIPDSQIIEPTINELEK